MKSKMTKCKVCNADIAKSAKTCPSCGAKRKKPIFKKWWFWVVIVLVIGIVGGPSGGSTEDASAAQAAVNDTPISNVTVPPSNPVEAPAPDPEPTPAPAPEVAPEPEATPEPAPEQPEQNESSLTMGQVNALLSAKAYLSFTAFSYDGLIEQLEYEKYSNEDAVYAADNCGADWNEQALQSALSRASRKLNQIPKPKCRRLTPVTTPANTTMV